MVTVFRLAFGMSPIMSTATSLFAIIPTSISGAFTHIKNKTAYLSLGIAAGIGGAVTSPVGVYLATLSAGWMIMTASALVIAYSAVTMLRKGFAMKPKAKADDFSEKPAVSEPEEERIPVTRKKLAIAVAIGLIAGVISGYAGVGGGFMIVPLMITFLGLSMKHTSGTSLIAVAILAIPACIEQGIFGNIDYMAGIGVAIGSIPGAIIGANLIKRIPERTLRLIFGGFLLISAIMLIINELL